MKTQCPSCHTKFKAPEEHENKKIKCPKCSQPFVITRLIEKIPKKSHSNPTLSKKGSGQDIPRHIEDELVVTFTGTESGSCFFCLDGQGSDDSVCHAPMHKIWKVKGEAWDRLFRSGLLGGLAVLLPAKTVFFHVRIIQLPRCERCRDLHDRDDKCEHMWGKLWRIGIIVCCVGGTMLAVFTQSASVVGCLVLSALFIPTIGVLLETFARPRLPAGVKRYTWYKRSSEFSKLAREGWEIGLLPPVEPYIECYLVPYKDISRFEEVTKSKT